MIKGLIFDFDGLILDTESPKYQAWEEEFRNRDCHLPISVWNICLGTVGVFDPIEYLEAQVNHKVDRDEIMDRCKRREVEILHNKTVLPGVLDHIKRAKEIGLKLAVASSSSWNWVTGHLDRINLLSQFDAIITQEHVDWVKPEPQLFLAACQALGLTPGQVVVYEDSLNGLLAAKAAKITCVVIPNLISNSPDLNQADLILHSLDTISLDQLLLIVNG